MTTEDHPTLPGLEPLPPEATAIERAAVAQLSMLERAGVLTPAHGIHRQLILDLAKVVGQAARQGKAAAVALASRELREAIATLPEAPAGTEDPWDRLQRELAAASAAAAGTGTGG